MKRQIEIAAKLIEKSQKIVLLTGAGISTSCGIPDFRGANGIYSYVGKKYNLPYPEAVFDIDYFFQRPMPFFDFSKEIFRNKPQPSYAHRFIAALETAKKINLMVTQNIDMLHELAGNKRMIACHGTYHTAHCCSCRKKFTLDQYEEQLKNGEIFKCPSCGAIVKPDIVFFGESLPESFIDFLSAPTETDLMIVVGTSLTVQPASQLPLVIKHRYNVPTILINRDPTPLDEQFDCIIREDIDKTFQEINSILQLL